jgi:hypothetical protein
MTMTTFDKHSVERFIGDSLAGYQLDRRSLLGGVAAVIGSIALGENPTPLLAQEAEAELRAIIAQGRTIAPARPGDPALGYLTQLPGVWKNADSLVGHGWNMIALPYKEPGKTVQPDTPNQNSVFRLLLNQFNETLSFTTLDKGVPNRGAAVAKVLDSDQHLAALQYIQDIQQIDSIDFPTTPDTPDTPHAPKSPEPTIHHEPGLFLNMFTPVDGGPQIARLATIPHGDSVLALGNGISGDGPPNFDYVGDFSPFPIGVNPDVDKNPYLIPYKTFRDMPFKGLFDPTKPLALLKAAIAGMNIKTTTTITLDTTLLSGGISNVPFVVKQANATRVRAIFWIEELNDLDASGRKQFLLQYAQRVLLDFFSAGDPKLGLIKWPHITINTMKLTS